MLVLHSLCEAMWQWQCLIMFWFIYWTYKLNESLIAFYFSIKYFTFMICIVTKQTMTEAGHLAKLAASRVDNATALLNVMSNSSRWWTLFLSCVLFSCIVPYKYKQNWFSQKLQVLKENSIVICCEIRKTGGRESGEVEVWSGDQRMASQVYMWSCKQYVY